VFDELEGRLVIKDARSTLHDRTLELLASRSTGYREIQATVHLGHLTASRTFHEGPGFADFREIAELFAEVALDWRGWKGSRVWESADDDFLLVCTHDGVSGVEVKVTLRGYEEDWEVTSGLFLETGQLDALARDVRRFVDSLPST
jgi:hypothetical protein